MKKLVVGAVAAASLGLCAAPAGAHHSTNLWFDMQKEQTIQAEFKELRWTNPHIIMRMYVTNPKTGQRELWSAEGHATALMSRLGWKPTSFKAGDKLTILGHPSRKGGPMISLLRVTKADGKVFEVNPK